MDVEMRRSPSPPTSISNATSRRSSLAILINDDYKPPTFIPIHRGGFTSSGLVHSPSPPMSASMSSKGSTPSNHGAAGLVDALNSIHDAAASTSSVSPTSHPGASGAKSGAGGGAGAPASSTDAGAFMPAPSPVASATAITTETKTATTTKPLSTAKPRSSKPAKPARSPSPSPPPLVPPPPMTTIRLEIQLGGPSNYEVDIRKRSKETGQRAETPPPAVKMHDSSDEEEEEPVSVAPGVKKKKKRPHAPEYYDTTDPFIDDSELAVDQREYFAQTKQSGFYVSSGEVALLKDKTPKKPKSKKLLLSSGVHLSGLHSERKHSGDGSRDAPISLRVESKAPLSAVGAAPSASVSASAPITTTGSSGDVDMDAHTGQKRKRHNSIIGDNGKKKKIVDETMFDPKLQAMFAEVRELIKKENWEQKGKFPPNLKAPLAKMALLAIQLDEYDDDFFNLMPSLFPYNRFTMSKLIKRTVFPDHLALLREREDQLLKNLEKLAKDGFAKAEEEYEKSVQAYEKRKEKARLEAENGGGGSGAPTRHSTEEMDVDRATPEAPTATQGGKENAPNGSASTAGQTKAEQIPSRRYRMTDEMKSIVWDLVLLSNECCRLENEKNTLEGSVIQVSDQGARKVLYQKIVAAFPEGWMSSGQISRDVSAMKKRMEREAEDD